VTRREWLYLCAGGAGTRVFGQSERPRGIAVMSGDVVPGAAMIWSRSDRPARMQVSWKTSERGEWRHVAGPHCIGNTDFTGRVELSGLPAGQTILYQVQLEDLAGGRARSEPLEGRFRTPPAAAADVRFLWTGDQVGQGWGIDRFMSECRALTNLVGNGVATLVVARWEGELDRETLDRELAQGPSAATAAPVTGAAD
jgi:phosphodiesterase/alkaline phosphatase D-like protein